MNSGITMRGLPDIRELFSQKNQELIRELGYLKLADVDDNAHFQATRQRIRNRILLTPVTFSEPVAIKQWPSKKKVPPDSHHREPRIINILVVKVHFPFLGSPELFGFAPHHVHIHPHDSTVLQPDADNKIFVDVEVEHLDKTVILNKAKEIMHTTFSLIRQINPHAKEWSDHKSPHLDSALEERKTEIIGLYA